MISFSIELSSRLLSVVICIFFYSSVCVLEVFIWFNVRLCIISVSIWVLVLLFRLVMIGISIVSVISLLIVFLKWLIMLEVRKVVYRLIDSYIRWWCMVC